MPTVTIAPTVAQAKNDIAVKLEPVATELDRPVFITHANGDSNRLFVVERGGLVRVVDEGELAGIVSIGDIVKHRLDEVLTEAEMGSAPRQAPPAQQPPTRATPRSRSLVM